MYPELFRLGGVTIHTYGLFVALGLLAGLYAAYRAASYRNIPGEFINHIFSGIILFGLMGARALYVLFNLNYFMANPVRIVMFWEGGLVFWGGFAAAAVWIIAESSKWGLSVPAVADVLAPAAALGHSLGRIGCFFAGCCYGKPSGSCPGVIFSNPMTLASPVNVPLHPVQLYSVLFLFFLFVFLYRMIMKKGMPYGYVFGLYLLCYGTFRFLIEFLRGDYRGPVVIGITPTQWSALAAISVGGFLIFRLSRKN